MVFTYMQPKISFVAIMCPIGRHFDFLSYDQPLQLNCTSPKIRNQQSLCCDTDTSKKKGNKRVFASYYFLCYINIFGCYLRRMIDCIVMLSQLAIDLNFHHHRQYQIYCHAVKNDTVSLWQMCPVAVVCKLLADDPIPTFGPIHLGHQLNIMASMDVRTFVLCCQLYVSVPLN